MTTVTRLLVRQAIGAYFGGTFNATLRCYQGGPLVSSGLGTVRIAFPKHWDDTDFTAGMAAGRGMGAIAIVELASDIETRLSIAGPPVTVSGNVTSGGIKVDLYRCSLLVYHLAEEPFSEDAQADVDSLIEAMKQLIREDRTLGTGGSSPPLITQAGEGRYGIHTTVYPPAIDENDRTGCWFEIQFDVMTQFIA